jgi:hypothetical protein
MSRERGNELSIIDVNRETGCKVSGSHSTVAEDSSSGILHYVDWHTVTIYQLNFNIQINRLFLMLLQKRNRSTV